MTEAPVKESPTNRAVGDLLGVSEASASRYRDGGRHPKFEVQQRIQEVYGWSVSDQAAAHSRGEWASEFERVLCRPKPID